jgi:hypothetical protein
MKIKTSRERLQPITLHFQFNKFCFIQRSHNAVCMKFFSVVPQFIAINFMAFRTMLYTVHTHTYTHKNRIKRKKKLKPALPSKKSKCFFAATYATSAIPLLHTGCFMSVCKRMCLYICVCRCTLSEQYNVEYQIQFVMYIYGYVPLGSRYICFIRRWNIMLYKS